MRDENVPNPPNPAEPPLAPHDLPEPAPQAAAWRRALKVVALSEPRASLGRFATSGRGARG
jgi:hypothetical protein